MKIFIENSPYIELLLGKGSYKNIKYKPSRFNFVVKQQELYLIHNTFTKGAIKLNKDEYDAYINGITDHAVYKKLVEKYYLIPHELQEYLLFNQVHDAINRIESNDFINSFNIFTTSDCNARCFYCFESGIKKEHMSKKTACDVVEYITKVSKGKKVSIRWFGGEPLYNLDVINTISKGLRDNGVKFTSYITTNGYLFDKKTIELAKKYWNLKYAQITIDGTEKIYNKVKNYIYSNAISPYKIVMSNITNLLLNGINVNVQINLFKEYEDIDNLVVELSKRFSSFSGFKICPNLVVDNKNKGILSENDVSLQSNKLISLIYSLKKMNLYPDPILNLNIIGNKCMANDLHHTIILPNGDLAKCDLHYEDSVYGSIYKKDKNIDVLDKYSEKHKLGDLCADCVYLPNCTHIKNCPTVGKPCNVLDRQIRYDFLKDAIVLAYKKFCKYEQEER